MPSLLTICLKDAQDLVSGDILHTGNTMGITEDNTNLGWGETLLCELAYVLVNFGGCYLQPRGRSPLVGQAGP